MNCQNPVYAVRLLTPDHSPTGKNVIKIVSMFQYDNQKALEDRYGKDNVLRLPCGKCTSCKENYRADWSVRCDMEARYHEKNCFLTLTYRPETCPKWVSKGHVRKFIRKLRRKGISCSFFSCGEYGEMFGRPHYHIILFGYFPPDAVIKPGVMSKSGFPVYHSNYLDKVWNKGFVEVQDFSQDTAFYVAGYVNKKTGKYDGFLAMSNSLGYQYMIDNFDELNDTRIYQARNGRVHRVPRAFKRVAEKLGHQYSEDPDQIDVMRKMENSELVQRGLTHRELLFPINGMKMKDKLSKRLKRL